MFSTVSLTARFIFTRQFAALLKGKLQLAAALENLSAEMPNGKFRVILQTYFYFISLSYHVIISHNNARTIYYKSRS